MTKLLHNKEIEERLMRLNLVGRWKNGGESSWWMSGGQGQEEGDNDEEVEGSEWEL